MEVWRNIIRFSSLSPEYYSELTRLHFPLHSQTGFPHLLSLYILDPPTTTLPTPSSHLPSPLPAISLLARPAADWLFPARAQ